MGGEAYSQRAAKASFTSLAAVAAWSSDKPRTLDTRGFELYHQASAVRCTARALQ